jgi:16S rRNA (guanine527-N7)-methyltransferase
MPNTAKLSAKVFEALRHAQLIGAIGPAPLAQHIDHAHGFADVIASIDQRPTSVLDLGAGGGIPGLVVAERFPDAMVTLLDGRAGRIAFLNDLREGLGWGYRLQVVGDRAERFGQSPGSRMAYEFVCARGFAKPAVTAECAAPLLAPGGSLIVSEPPTDERRLSRWNELALARLGLELTFTMQREFHYAVLTSTSECPAEYPRRVGVPEKRPLF